MKILFMGTPAFAVPSLKRLVADGHEICGVFTQPDKPKNRGHKMTFSPVKEYALSENIPVYQPVKMRDGTALSIVRELQPELTVVAAYGKILPDDILEIRLHQRSFLHFAALSRRSAHQLGDFEWGNGNGRVYHAYGRRIGCRRRDHSGPNSDR